VKRERFTLAANNAEFWKVAARPRAAATQLGERFIEYLKRVMLHAAPLTISSVFRIARIEGLTPLGFGFFVLTTQMATANMRPSGTSTVFEGEGEDRKLTACATIRD
jgi:hypothetical protein